MSNKLLMFFQPKPLLLKNYIHSMDSIPSVKLKKYILQGIGIFRGLFGRIFFRTIHKWLNQSPLLSNYVDS